jgi:prepilin-type N-terminal cleavage/methylation domain-containing protein
MPATKAQRGFTLLELLVSTALTAIVLTVLMSGLRLTEAAWLRGSERLRIMQQTLAENEAIRAQVSSAIPRQLSAKFEQRQVQLTTFRGNSREARFFSNYSWQGGRNAGLWLVSYRVIHQSEGKEQLVVGEQGFSSEQQLAAFLLDSQLSNDSGLPYGQPADHIELFYLRPSSPGSPAAWVQEWKCDDQNQKQLPRGVRIHWQFGKQEQDLTLVIPVWDVPQ